MSIKKLIVNKHFSQGMITGVSYWLSENKINSSNADLLAVQQLQLVS